MHFYGRYHSSILKDEDFAQGIQLWLVEIAKDGYIKAEDIVDYVATPEIQEKLGSKAQGINVCTAQRWLQKLDWRYRKKKKGMYVDGHEREDVIEYRKSLVQQWGEYEKRMVTYDYNSNTNPPPNGFNVPQTGRF